MAPDELHTIASLWLAMTAEAVRSTAPAVEVIRIPCRCGGSLVVELTGDPVVDDERLVDAFTREHPNGLHDPSPVPSHVDKDAVVRQLGEATWIRPRYNGPMKPVHPCREMPTRHCPASYDAVCGDRPCARYEAEDENVWLPEIIGDPRYSRG